MDSDHPTPFFPLYDIDMHQETINGAPVAEDQITAWAAEAEQGFDVQALKRRGRGRPGRGAEPSQVVALRLTADELAAIDASAARAHKTRSEAIREALAAYVG
jgi:hypothetical protein